MKELFKSFQDAANERVKNPIFGAYLISWLIINWRVILILSDNKLLSADKIDRIATFGYSILFLYPLAASIIYLYISPWISCFIQKIQNPARIEAIKDRFKQQKLIATSKEEVIKKEAENETLKEDIIFNASYSRKKKEIELDNLQLNYEEKYKKLLSLEQLLNEKEALISQKEQKIIENTSHIEKEKSDIEKSIFKIHEDRKVLDEIRNNLEIEQDKIKSKDTELKTVGDQLELFNKSLIEKSSMLSKANDIIDGYRPLFVQHLVHTLKIIIEKKSITNL